MNTSKLILIAVLYFLATAPCAAQTDIKAFTEPYRSIEIAASETGTIANLSVNEGDEIKAGSILANLNEEVLAASLAVAQKATESEGAIKSATAELKMQQERLEKLKGLFERRHASQTELDRAQSQFDIAAAKLESVQDDIRIKNLEMRRIEAQLEQRRLRTPIDGIVTQIFKDEGEFVSPTDPKVMTVVQLNPLRVVFSVPQNQTSRLKGKTSVPVILDGKELIGKIEFVSPTADAQSGTCRVKIKIDNPNLQLSSGQACFLKGFEAKSTRRKFAKTSTARLSTNKPD
jgi:RND family efflux transporter MFP subunit